MSSCSLHPSKESTGACANCGKLTCPVCNVEVGGKSYCRPCADKLFADKTSGGEAATPSAPEVKKTVRPEAEAKPVETGLVKTQQSEDKEVGTVTAAAPASAAAAAIEIKEKQPRSKVGWAWWIPPAILGWIGGLVSWLPNKDIEPKTARYMLFGGIGMSVVHGIIGLVLVLALVIPLLNINIKKPSTAVSPPVSQPAQSSNSQPSQTADTKSPAEDGTIVQIKPARGTEEPPARVPKAYQLTSLFTQEVQPSSEAQTVDFDGKLSVVIPGGGLKEAQKLTISSVADSPPIGDGKELLALYDISFEKQHAFDNDLTFNFFYDPASLPAGAEPETLLEVAVLDESEGTWAYVPSTVDTAHRVVTVRSPHNGQWELHKLIDKRAALSTDHFYIKYSRADFPTPITKIIQGKTYSSPGTIAAPEDKIYAQYPDVPRLIVDIGYFADKAWEAYASRSTFDKKPAVGAMGKVYIYVDKDHGSPVYRQGVITMGLHLGSSTDWASHISHEIFHGVQYTDYSQWLHEHNWLSAESATRELWWLESTAEYAAYKIACERDKPGPDDPPWPPTLDYLSKDFFSNDMGEIQGVKPARLHAYQNTWFWHFLSEKHFITFPYLYNAVAGSGYFDAAYLQAAEYLKENDRKLDVSQYHLEEAYRQYAEYLLFDQDSPINWPAITAKNYSLPLNQPYKTVEFSIPAGLTSQQCGWQFEIDAGSGKRTLRVTDLQCSNLAPTSDTTVTRPYYAYLDIWMAEGNDRQDAKQMEHIDLAEKLLHAKNFQFDIKDKEVLYFVVTANNRTGDARSLKFIISEAPALSVSGPDMGGKDGVIEQDYIFKAAGTGIPARGVTYSWYIDGEKKSSEEVGNVHNAALHFCDAGSYTVKARATWHMGQKEVSAEGHTSFVVGEAKLGVKGPKELSEGEKGIMGEPYTFWVESENMPDSVIYTWSPGGATGSQFIFDKGEPGKNTVDVKAEWKGGGCEGSRTGSCTFEIGEPVIDDIEAVPSPGTAGTRTSFKASGSYIPGDSLISWEFGDTKKEGNQSVTGIDTPVSHTYKAAKTYDVKVSVIDNKSGNTLTSKQIRYVVKPSVLPTVTLVAPAAVKAGKGVTGVPYSFTIDAPDVPKDAHNVWLLNGKQIEDDAYQVDFSGKYFKEGTYTLKVVMTWKDALQGNQSISDTISFQIKSQAVSGLQTCTICNGAPSTGLIYVAVWDGKTADYKSGYLGGTGPACEKKALLPGHYKVTVFWMKGAAKGAMAGTSGSYSTSIDVVEGGSNAFSFSPQ